MNLVVRNLHFEIDESVPRYWHGGRKSVSVFFDNLSVFFPLGERFFVKSVRAHQGFIKDEPLVQEARAFCGQEGVHAREHQRYNEMLVRHGYPIEAMERRVEATLERVSMRAPENAQLAVTCALEHFTALLGKMVLENPRLLEGAHPAMAALWRWHAAEENEHKSVAFDVYLASGGSYARRVVAMLGATVIFWSKVIDHQVQLMRTDGISDSFEEWRALGRFLFVDPGGMLPLFGRYLEYFRPAFHPSDIDTTALLDDWRRDFDASPVYARSRVATQGARSPDENPTASS